MTQEQIFELERKNRLAKDEANVRRIRMENNQRNIIQAADIVARVTVALMISGGGK